MTAAKAKKTNRVSFCRDEDGLLSDTEYVFSEDGTIDWRGMIKPSFLVANRQKTSKTDVSALQDTQLIILLGGIKDLAQIRGFSKVEYKVYEAGSDYACVSCRIEWLPNFETQGLPVVFESTANAGFNNTSDFGQKYLVEIAENRSFCRAVRNFLRINIVSNDEVAPKISSAIPDASGKTSSSNATDPYFILSSLMKAKNVSLSSIKSKLKKEGLLEAEEYTSVKDISKDKVFELVGRLKKK
jgi:hypothetical protein|tara:strand:- start:316 stop:1041 length:726 start_codon:yes stop_codon:yes gene_type:complete